MSIERIILNGTEYELSSSSGRSGLTLTQKQTLMDIVNIIATFTASDARDYIDAFNEAWNVAVTGIRLNKSSISFNGYGSEQLRATLIPEDATGTVTWASSNINVATVSNNGLVEPVADGSCTITASCAGFTASCSVTAINIPQTFTVSATLSHCTSSNTRTTAVEGTSYTTTITADTGYELSTVTCTMGGIAQTVSDGVINIANVTGNIVINAVAVAESTYTSGNGYEYTKRFTVEPNSTIAAFLTKYGTMEELEELTLTGKLIAANSTGAISALSLDIGTYCPHLKKLIIAPTWLTYNQDNHITTLTCGHYIFNNIPASLTYIQLGSVNQEIYFVGSSYFRNDGLSAGLSKDYITGNTNGLELVLYTDQYLADAGFMGTMADTTTVKQYLYTDGSVLSA